MDTNTVSILCMFLASASFVFYFGFLIDYVLCRGISAFAGLCVEKFNWTESTTKQNTMKNTTKSATI